MPTHAVHVPIQAAAADTTPALQDVLRSLLMQLCSSEARNPLGYRDDEAQCEQVILDVNVDGARYLLLRLPHPNRQRVILSPREQEIVRMVSQGHPNKVIADVLGISLWTVCTHIRRIFAKLGVTSRAAMVARLLETGIIAEHMITSPTR